MSEYKSYGNGRFYLKITKITFPLKKWRYLIIFQSKSQAISWLVTLLFCMIFISYMLSLDEDTGIPLEGVLLGAAIGASFSLIAVLPSKFMVHGNSLGILMSIEVILLKMNYVEENRIGELIIYRQNLPRLLRWDEGNIRISKDGDVFSLTGGYVSLRKIRNNIINSCI